MNDTTRGGTDRADRIDHERQLILLPNIDDSDGFYDELLAAHEGLEEAASNAFNARLVLVLCNHIGDRGLLREALAAAASGDRTSVADRPA